MRAVLPYRLLSIPLAVLLAGCGGMGHRGDVAPVSQEVVVSSEAEQREQNPLTPDIIFNVLAGEIALQRGDLDLAYSHQLDAATLGHDAAAAERATRIAIHQQDNSRALSAVNRWVKLSPDDLPAHTLAVVVAMRVGDEESALQHLRRAVILAEAQEEDGLLHAAATVAQAKKVEMALKLIQRLALEYPRNPKAHYAVALTAIMAERYPLAETEIRKVLQKDPKMAKAYVLLARTLELTGDLDGAHKVLRDAVGRFQDDTMLRTAYARLLLDQDEYELAYEQFLRLSRESPESSEVRLSLGIIAIQLDRHAAAREHLHELIRMEELVDAAFFYLGRSAEMEQKDSVAIAWYQQVKQGEDLLVDAQTRIARLYMGQGDLERSHAILQMLRRKMPERAVQLYMLEGELLQQRDDPKRVLALYSVALQEHAGDRDLLYARSLYGASQGMLAQAEKDLLQVLKGDPDNADFLNALGYILIEHTERHQEALGYIERALAIEPEAPAILDSMGWVQFRLGNNEEALQYLQRAFKQLQDGEIAAHLGELLWVTGDRVAAEKIWQEALEKSPDSDYLLRTIKRLKQ